jgi:hypothetical protein
MNESMETNDPLIEEKVKEINEMNSKAQNDS